MTKYDNSGIISQNDRKQKDSHPDFQGQITVNGVEYWLSGWEKEGSRGPFISLSVKPKEEQQAPRKSSIMGKAKKAEPAPSGFDDDDIPF